MHDHHVIIVRGAPLEFAHFQAGHGVRTPHELVRHMTSVIDYARTMQRGGTFAPAPLPTFAAEMRLAGAPVQSEDFIFAAVRTDDVSARQADPVAPDARWRASGVWAPESGLREGAQ